MSTSIEIGYFNKKVNSTACQGFSGTGYDCVLKEGCDIKNPIVQVKGSFGNYNYAKWSSRYYWVDKVVSFPNGIFEAHMHLDPLATYKDAILNTKAFTTFSSNLLNTEIDDIRMQPEILSRSSINSADIFDSAPTPTGGSVIITTFEAGLGSANQGVKTYAISLAGFLAMLKNLQSSLNDHVYSQTAISTNVNNRMTDFTTPNDAANMIGALGTVFLHDVLQFFANIAGDIGGIGSWRDNLLKAIYVPFTVDQIPGNGSKAIYLGYLAAGGTGKLVDPVNVKTKQTTIQIPFDGDCTTYHFLKYPKYSQFQVVCCGGQYANLDADLFRDKSPGDSLGVYSAVDMCSGDWSAAITESTYVNSMRLASFGGNLGIDIIGLAGKGGGGAAMNYVTGGLKLAGSILTMGGIGSYNANASTSENAIQIGTGIGADFINNPVSSAPGGMSGNGISSIFMNGSTGYNSISIAGLCKKPKIIIDGNYDTYCSQYGYPSNRYDLLSASLGGFVKCAGASVQCQGTQSDTAYINNVLNSGCYIEN